jgi:hypothetical protein
MATEDPKAQFSPTKPISISSDLGQIPWQKPLTMSGVFTLSLLSPTNTRLMMSGFSRDQHFDRNLPTRGQIA